MREAEYMRLISWTRHHGSKHLFLSREVAHDLRFYPKSTLYETNEFSFISREFREKKMKQG
jgi:hypothetical protein